MPAVHPPLVWQIELDEDSADTKLFQRGKILEFCPQTKKSA
jgi:hypothetical protein